MFFIFPCALPQVWPSHTVIFIEHNFAHEGQLLIIRPLDQEACLMAMLGHDHHNFVRGVGKRVLFSKSYNIISALGMRESAFLKLTPWWIFRSFFSASMHAPKQSGSLLFFNLLLSKNIMLYWFKDTKQNQFLFKTRVFLLKWRS